MTQRPGTRAWDGEGGARYWLVSLDEFGTDLFRAMDAAAEKEHLRIVKTDRPGSDRILTGHAGERRSICGAGLDVTGLVSAWFGPQQLVDYLYPLLQSGIHVRLDPALQHGEAIRPFSDLVDQTRLQGFWTAFTDRFPIRDSRTPAGREAALGLAGHLGTLVPDRADVTVGLDEICAPIVQPSVVVRLEGTQPGHAGIVLGCHLDTTEGTPGGDDDASGVATLVEALRALVASRSSFLGHVYFVFHAAEEIGKYGSAQLAKNFRTYNVPVGAMLQFDMTGRPDPQQRDGTGKIYLTEDPYRINPWLNAKLRNIVDRVLCDYGTTSGSRTINYSASDHAWWAHFGYPAAFAYEGPGENPDKHTMRDTTADPAHMVHFARLAVAAAVEFAEPA